MQPGGIALTVSSSVRALFRAGMTATTRGRPGELFIIQQAGHGRDPPVIIS